MVLVDSPGISRVPSYSGLVISIVSYLPAINLKLDRIYGTFTLFGSIFDGFNILLVQNDKLLAKEVLLLIPVTHRTNRRLTPQL